MKKSIAIISIAASALFSGSLMAGAYTDRQAEDIVNGAGNVGSSPSQPFVASNHDQRGLDEYIKYNANEVSPAKGYVPFERHGDDRDNSADLIDNV